MIPVCVSDLDGNDVCIEQAFRSRFSVRYSRGLKSGAEGSITSELERDRPDFFFSTFRNPFPGTREDFAEENAIARQDLLSNGLILEPAFVLVQVPQWLKPDLKAGL